MTSERWVGTGGAGKDLRRNDEGSPEPGGRGGLDHRRVAKAMEALTGAAPKVADHEGGVTSDLSVDEVLLLHGAGWEAAGMVFGVSWWSIPWAMWQWQREGEVEEASAAFAGAFEQAGAAMRQECAALGGAGVVGVGIEFRVQAHHVDIALTGTAIRSLGRARTVRDDAVPFLSDLSARDFVLLERAGWLPLDVVAGASFVVAPRRSARQWAAQQGRNTELAHLTRALYDAREKAMEGMQSAGLRERAEGIVNVKLREGPLGASGRLVQFVAFGTAMRVGPGGHRSIAPQVVVPLDETVRQFEASSLSKRRGARGRR